jgi:hypothetical protein
MERRAPEPQSRLARSRVDRLRNTAFRGAVACVVAALATALAACAPADAQIDEATTSSVPQPLIANPEGKLTRTAAQLFGGSVVITSTHAFVGELDIASGRGSVVAFQRSGSTWTQSQILTPSDGHDGDMFGCSVAAEGDFAIIGTCKLWYSQNAGAAYVFERNGSTWSQTQKIVPTDSHQTDGFGLRVALSQNTAAITAFDLMADGMWLYVFRRGSGSSFSQLAKVGPGTGTFDGFGWDVDVDGDTIAVGAPWHGNTGAVFVYENSGGTTWNETKVVPTGAAQGDLVGAAVAIEGTTLLAGSPREEAAVSPGKGKVHVFTRGPIGWAKTATLEPSDGSQRDCFGRSVTLVDGAALVGAPFDCDGTTPGPRAGAAYWFLERSAGWEQGPKIQASDSSPEDYFGIDVEAEANRAIVGAGFSILWESEQDGARAAYVFHARREEGDPCSLDTQCTTGTCSNAVCSVLPDGGTGGTGGTSGTGGTGTGGSAGSSTGGSAGSATGGSGGSGGDAGTAGQGATSGAAGSAETGGSAGTAGIGGSSQGGSAGSSASPNAGTPGTTDNPEVSGFYACTTRTHPRNSGPGAAALLVGLLSLCSARRRRA